MDAPESRHIWMRCGRVFEPIVKGGAGIVATRSTEAAGIRASGKTSFCDLCASVTSIRPKVTVPEFAT
jgi:hypothetical protein